MLEIINQTKARLPRQKLETIASLFLEAYQKPDYLVTLVISGDRKIRAWNREHRGQDKVTDVLSFRHEEYMGNILGEIIINRQELERLAKYQELFVELKLILPPRRQPEFLFYFLFVHGLLHLVGYNDDSEEERQEMMRLGKRFMKKIASCGIIRL